MMDCNYSAIMAQPRKLIIHWHLVAALSGGCAGRPGRPSACASAIQCWTGRDGQFHLIAVSETLTGEHQQPTLHPWESRENNHALWVKEWGIQRCSCIAWLQWQMLLAG